jgi:hypothetical protein
MAPLEEMIEDSGIVQSDIDRRVALKDLDERQIGLLVCVLGHGLEIADGLVVMNGKDELYFRHRVGTLGLPALSVENQSEILDLWSLKVNQKQENRA